MTELAYSSLYSALIAIQESDELSNRPDLSPIAFLNAWSVVDSVNRLYSLCSAIPGFKQKLPFFQILYKKINHTTKFRNVFQHLDTEIQGLAHSNNSIFGTLTWLTVENPKEHKIISCMLMNGAQSGELHALQNPIGLKFFTPLDHISLTLADNTINLSEVCRAVFQFVPNLENHLSQNFSGISPNGANIFVKANLTMVLPT